MTAKAPDREPLIATNRRAWRDYEILETLEAGIILVGTEIKSLRRHAASLDDSFARIDRDGVPVLYHLYIQPYEQGNRANVEATRSRTLLLHKQQIARLAGKMARTRLLLVPLKMYFKPGFAKVELALARGKLEFEKRDTIQRRESQREMDRARRRFRE